MYLGDRMLGVVDERLEGASKPRDFDEIANWTWGSGL
jgi:hypothetical protein